MSNMPNVLNVGNSLFLKTNNTDKNSYINLSKATEITIDPDRKTVKAFYADISSGYSDNYCHRTFKCEDLSDSELKSLSLDCIA